MQFSAVLSIALICVACNAAPSYKQPAKAIQYSGNQTAFKCPAGKNYEAKKGSFISWHATKITPQGVEQALVGRNDIQGTLNLKDESWETAEAEIDFVTSSTNSEDAIRDSRINSFVFGLTDSVPFKFKLSGIEGEVMEVKDNESRNFTALGTLYVGNQEATIHIPILVKDYLGLISITPAEVFKLNVRALSPMVNGVNLVDRIQQLLSFVPGVEMQDEVMIDFSLDFNRTCL